MTTFLIICVLLLAVALLFVVLPLWRNAVKNNDVVRDAANLEIFRDQVAEMDADLKNGLLTQESYDQGKRELQARLLDEVKETQAATPVRRSHKVLTVALAVLLPLLAAGVYWKVGNRDAFAPPDVQGMAAVQNDPAIKDLEDKVEKNPKDTDSLLALARAYASAGAYIKSASIYNKLTQLVPQEAQLWADFADVLAMASGQVLSGHPTMLINKALAIDPNNAKANALAGAAAMERGDYAASIKYWEKLATMVPPGSEDAQMVANALQQARAALARGDRPAPVQPGMGPAMMGGGDETQTASAGASSGKERITGSVTLSDALKSKVNPGDMLFVLARAESGPPMPLAVMRKQAGDLPLKFSLDDSMAMAPQMRLSNFDRVVVVARITKSGNPIAQSGDLEGVSATLKPGASDVKLVIDTVVK